jgi:hypothetical protein
LKRWSAQARASYETTSGFPRCPGEIPQHHRAARCPFRIRRGDRSFTMDRSFRGVTALTVINSAAMRPKRSSRERKSSSRMVARPGLNTNPRRLSCEKTARLRALRLARETGNAPVKKERTAQSRGSNAEVGITDASRRRPIRTCRPPTLQPGEPSRFR